MLKKIPYAALVILLLVSCYYFFETMVDTVPSIMVNELMQSFHLSAFELGVLDVSYFILAALIQIPGGYALDKYGAQRVLPFAACLCALGLLIFAESHSFSFALLGRMLAGLGSAFGLLGALFVITTKIPARWLALCLGLAIMIGLSGALLDSPMSLLKQVLGWRDLVLLLAAMAAVFALLFYLLLPRDLHSSNRLSYSWQQLRVLCKDTGLWRIALYGGIMYLPAGMLGSLWGVNFILAADPSLSLSLAAMINSLIFLGWIIGSPLVGLSSDLFKQRKLFLQLGALLCLVLLGLLYGKAHFNALALTSIFLGLGIFSSFSGLTFVMGVERHTTTRAMTIGWINMWAIIPMLIMNPLFGHVLDYFWQGQVNSQGVHVFSLNSYQLALWPLMTLIAIALALSFGRLQDKSIHII